MKTILSVILAILTLGVHSGPLSAQGFTDSHVTFYGEVLKSAGANTVLLQSGTLKMTFTSQRDPANHITIETPLRPTGPGSSRAYSYALQVPLAYLPDTRRINDYLAIERTQTDFQIENILVDDVPATLPDGSVEFYGLSFSNRGDYYRMDLLVHGDILDEDSDGLPDWWEVMNRLDPGLADSQHDPDGDGWSNLIEFNRGSNPQESNLDPHLATTSLSVPEHGEAGFLLQFHDSDSAPEDIAVTVDSSGIDGFRLNLNGTPSHENLVHLTLFDLQSGRLTIVHQDVSIRSARVAVTWNDGGDPRSDTVALQVNEPSSSDGNDASLWLDATTLSEDLPVSTWTDRSGNDRSAMQPVEENRPMAVRSGSKQGVHFDMPSSHLFFQDATIPSGDHTVLASWRSQESGATSQVLLSSNRGFLRLEPTTEAVSYPGAPLYQADGVAVRGYESSPGEIATSIFRREDSTLQNIFGLSYNGREIEPEALPAVLPTIGARRLALPVEDPVTNSFGGTLHELLVFPVALPEQKLRDVHDYLQSKWSSHVIWDFSTTLRPVELDAAGSNRSIIRGGHGNDDLGGGALGSVISGGPGNDILRAGSGIDTFVFGAIDTGEDVIVGFDPEKDIIDLSALFWGESGDARRYLSTRLDTSFDTPIPTLDTVLILQRPGEDTQEITLKNTIIDSESLIPLVVEGHIRMGGLSIPTEVALSLAPGSQDATVLSESSEESFSVEVTRTGEGAAGALEVPLGLFQDALGEDIVLEGDVRKSGQRAVVSFERGETAKVITFRPLPDLETEGPERWETAILPHFRYTVAGDSAARTVSDEPMVHLEVAEINALTTGQAARIRVVRDGTPDEALLVNLELDGTALEGTHINSVPRSIIIPAGHPAAELTITTMDGWNGTLTRMALIRVIPSPGYLVGNPHEATIYAARSAPSPDVSNFDRWLTATTDGEISTVIDLLQSDHAGRFHNLLRAYAAGQPASDDLTAAGLTFRLVDNRPVLSAPLSASAADLRWEVQDADRDNQWRDASTSFSEELSGDSLTLIGPPREEGDETKLYRLVFTVDQGSRLTEGIERFTSSGRYGLRGSSSWRTDPTTGYLTSTAATPNSTSRLIVEITKPTLLEFDMFVEQGTESDSLAFYINGERVAEATDNPVQFRRQIDPEDSALLMWEFQGENGRAVIASPASTAPTPQD